MNKYSMLMLLTVPGLCTFGIVIPTCSTWSFSFSESLVLRPFSFAGCVVGGVILLLKKQTDKDYLVSKSYVHYGPIYHFWTDCLKPSMLYAFP